jgi:hypothetical protein
MERPSEMYQGANPIISYKVKPDMSVLYFWSFINLQQLLSAFNDSDDISELVFLDENAETIYDTRTYAEVSKLKQLKEIVIKHKPGFGIDDFSVEVNKSIIIEVLEDQFYVAFYKNCSPPDFVYISRILLKYNDMSSDGCSAITELLLNNETKIVELDENGDMLRLYDNNTYGMNVWN